MRPEERVGQILRGKDLTLALAESCTGGLISSMITDVPGSSEYFLASYVAYSNSSKVTALGVRPETLAEHGAVSEETAREMAAGARRAASAKVAVAVTGIAGPGGGTEAKPVGLVHFALDVLGEVTVERRVFPGDRAKVKRAAAEHALNLLICRLI
jgi:PncC family amidohydrolase